MGIDEQVRNYILEHILFSTDVGLLALDESFLAKGIIDSTGMLEVIFFLEETFAIKVEDQEMVPDNLDSVQKIAAYVQRKLAG